MSEAAIYSTRSKADYFVPHARPSGASSSSPIEYPESDGLPMAETPVHWNATVNAALPLKEYFRERSDVYIGSDMMMYYERDNPGRSVSPDVFVTFGVPKLPERRVWFTWIEGKLADFVLEITSKSTRKQDEGRKKRLYAELGVKEYWQFDPQGDYLNPILKGHRLDGNGVYRPLRLEWRSGALCQGTLLGLELRLDSSVLRFYDPVQGVTLPTYREQQSALRKAQATQHQLEARLAELKKRLRRNS